MIEDQNIDLYISYRSRPCCFLLSIIVHTFYESTLATKGESWAFITHTKYFGSKNQSQYATIAWEFAFLDKKKAKLEHIYQVFHLLGMNDLNIHS